MAPLSLQMITFASFLFTTSSYSQGHEFNDSAARNKATFAHRSIVKSHLTKSSIQKIYDTVTYPNNIPILQHGANATPPGLLNENASGRVSPLGNFTGFQDSAEYFFALSPNPGQTGPGIPTPFYGAFTNARLVSFTSGCPEVASSVVYLDTTVVYPHGTAPPSGGLLAPAPPPNGSYISTLKEIAFWRFDEKGAVLYYDAWIPNLPLWFGIYSGKDFSDPVIQEAVITASVCPQIMARCTGANEQYHGDILECVATLTLTKPFGTFDEVWGDNVVCRLIHVILAQVRPDVHCPHVGPTGGGKCVNIDYNTEYIADDNLLFGGDNTFVCL